MELYVKLVELRKKCGISQSDAATRIGVSRQTISKWESGTVMPDMKNLSLIAEVYNVSVEDLLRDDFDINSYINDVEDEADEEIAPEIAVFDEGIVANENEAEVEEAVVTEAEAEEADFDEETCNCGCCCEESDTIDEETAEKKVKKVYDKVKTKLVDATAVASEKISTIQISKKTALASLAAVCGTSAVLAASLKKGPAKTSAAIIAGATFAIGAGIVIKDLYDAQKSKNDGYKCDCDEDCGCECAEAAEDCCCDAIDVEE